MEILAGAPRPKGTTVSEACVAIVNSDSRISTSLILFFGSRLRVKYNQVAIPRTGTTTATVPTMRTTMPEKFVSVLPRLVTCDPSAVEVALEEVEESPGDEEFMSDEVEDIKGVL